MSLFTECANHSQSEILKITLAGPCKKGGDRDLTPEPHRRSKPPTHQNKFRAKPSSTNLVTRHKFALFKSKLHLSVKQYKSQRWLPQAMTRTFCRTRPRGSRWGRRRRWTSTTSLVRWGFRFGRRHLLCSTDSICADFVHLSSCFLVESTVQKCFRPSGRSFGFIPRSL